MDVGMHAVYLASLADFAGEKEREPRIKIIECSP